MLGWERIFISSICLFVIGHPVSLELAEDIAFVLLPAVLPAHGTEPSTELMHTEDLLREGRKKEVEKMKEWRQRAEEPVEGGQEVWLGKGSPRPLLCFSPQSIFRF